MNLLNQLIPEYADNKAQLDKIKAVVDEQNAQIKEEMKSADLKSYEVDGYKATYSVQKRESMNEAKLLLIAHKYEDLLKDTIKTKEYIDMDKLEELLYKGQLPQDILQEVSSCVESKEVVTLRVTKKKGKA